ncbi:hypothetical protein PUN28_009098 [Cardiocondyla obscurior]|uniref:Uncharacterized protein n=1 Tax=Cardiocondyla obscurior TaxID=286306 RepID=A0AAW2FQG1_9HYME
MHNTSVPKLTKNFLIVYSFSARGFNINFQASLLLLEFLPVTSECNRHVKKFSTRCILLHFYRIIFADKKRIY